MWFYRFRNSAPLNKRVLKGLLIQKGEWTEARIKMDFGAFNRFMEDKFEQTKELEPKVKEDIIVKSKSKKKIEPGSLGDKPDELAPKKRTTAKKKKESNDAERISKTTL